jgi:hypothetical protein
MWTTTEEAASIGEAFFVSVACILGFLRIFQPSRYDSICPDMLHTLKLPLFFKAEFLSFAPSLGIFSLKELLTGKRQWFFSYL